MDRDANSAPSAAPSHAEEDLRLVEAFLAGDEGAFDRLVHRYQTLAYRVARGVVRRHADADDVAQEAFVKAYHKLDTFRGEASFRTWFLRIVTHAALNHRRQWWVRRRSGAEPEHVETVPPEEGPEARVLEDEERRRVLQAIEGLPERQRETVRRRLQGAENYAGIARAMGVSVGTVKANFHHAVRNLRRNLGVAEPPAPGAGEASPAETDEPS